MIELNHVSKSYGAVRALDGVTLSIGCGRKSRRSRRSGTSLSGGRFSIVSSVIGALVVQTITTTILAFGIAPEVIRVFKAVIVIVICLAQSPAFLAKLRGVFAKKKAVSNG